MPIMTGLSGNEIFCLGLKNLSPGEMVIGNSVHSLGFLGGLGAGLRGIMGGEVAQVTEIIREGRLQSHGRIMQEAKEFGAHGVTGVTSELRHVQGNVEFLSVGSCVHSPDAPAPARAFSSSSDGQELFCLIDAGYTPRQFVIGNVAYYCQKAAPPAFAPTGQARRNGSGAFCDTDATAGTLPRLPWTPPLGRRSQPTLLGRRRRIHGSLSPRSKLNNYA
jgi:uncharacterized protein YbjQ (UPF0145 family)